MAAAQCSVVRGVAFRLWSGHGEEFQLSVGETMHHVILIFRRMFRLGLRSDVTLAVWRRHRHAGHGRGVKRSISRLGERHDKDITVFWPPKVREDLWPHQGKQCLMSHIMLSFRRSWQTARLLSPRWLPECRFARITMIRAPCPRRYRILFLKQWTAAIRQSWASRSKGGNHHLRGTGSGWKKRLV